MSKIVMSAKIITLAAIVASLQGCIVYEGPKPAPVAVAAPVNKWAKYNCPTLASNIKVNADTPVRVKFNDADMGAVIVHEHEGDLLTLTYTSYPKDAKYTNNVVLVVGKGDNYQNMYVSAWPNDGKKHDKPAYAMNCEFVAAVPN